MFARKRAAASIAAMVVLMLSSVTSAQAQVDNSELIAQLKAQISALLAQVQALQAPQGGATWCHTFNANLRIGDQGTEVSALQDALVKAGINIPVGESNVDPTGAFAFGESIATAVVRFQQQNGIPATGYVGPLTRAKLNQLYGCNVARAPVAPSPDMPTTCVDQAEGKAVITSLSAYTGPIGTHLEIRGCNFAGFEGDKDAWIENAQGVKGLLRGEAGSTSNLIKTTLASPLCQQNNSASGLDCSNYLNLSPGKYGVYVTPWGTETKSNVARFTVSAAAADWKTLKTDQVQFSYPSTWHLQKYYTSDGRLAKIAVGPSPLLPVGATVDAPAGLIVIALSGQITSPEIATAQRVTIGGSMGYKQDQITGGDQPNPAFMNAHVIKYSLSCGSQPMGQSAWSVPCNQVITYFASLGDNDKYLNTFNQLLSTFQVLQPYQAPGPVG